MAAIKAYGNIPESISLRVLGPVMVRGHGAALTEPPPIGRALLGALALAAGEFMTAQQLQWRLWPGDERDHGAVATAVRRLRLWLVGHGAGGTDIVTKGSGYQLAGVSDLAHFRALVSRADEVVDGVRLDLLRQALALWTGPALANVSATRRDLEALRGLERERLVVIRYAAAAALDVDDVATALAWLEPLATAHAHDDLIQASMVDALAAAGRLDEAEQWYQQSCRLLADLGVEPGEHLQAVQARVRRLPVMNSPSRGAGALCTLPADLIDFVGRQAELAEVARALRESGAVVISGRPGMGATALAVRAAHSLRGHYPAGQLVASGPRAWAEFERQWGGPLPAEPGLLLIADDVPDPADIVAGRGPAALIVTTRDAPAAGTPHVPLAALSPQLARQLLAGSAGRRLDEDPWGFDRAVRACKGSPLAIREAGALLARRPHWTVDDLANHLVSAARSRMTSIGKPDFLRWADPTDADTAIPGPT